MSTYFGSFIVVPFAMQPLVTAVVESECRSCGRSQTDETHEFCPKCGTQYQEVTTTIDCLQSIFPKDVYNYPANDFIVPNISEDDDVCVWIPTMNGHYGQYMESNTFHAVPLEAARRSRIEFTGVVSPLILEIYHKYDVKAEVEWGLVQF